MHSILIGSAKFWPTASTFSSAQAWPLASTGAPAGASQSCDCAAEVDVEVRAAEEVAEGERVVVGDRVIGRLADRELRADLADADAGWSPSVTGSVSVIVVPSLTESGPIDASRPMSLASSFASTSAPVVSRTTTSGVRSSLIGMPMSSCALASYCSSMSPWVSTATMSAKSSETFSGASIGATERSVASQSAAARAEADAEPDDEILRAVPDDLVRRRERTPLHRRARLARERVVADERDRAVACCRSC